MNSYTVPSMNNNECSVSSEARQFNYNGFEAQIKHEASGLYTGSLTKSHFDDFFKKVTRNTEEELLLVLKDSVDEYYRTNKKYLPLDTSQSNQLYWLLALVALSWLALVAAFYLIKIEVDSGLPSVSANSEWIAFSSFFNNFSAPVVALISFFGLLWTISQQKKAHNVSLEELRLTRLEVELTRKEMVKTTMANEQQAQALEKQVKDARATAMQQQSLADLQRDATKLQQFESTFYSLLSEHNQLLLQLSKNEYLLEVVSSRRGAHNVSIHVLRRELLSDPDLCAYFRTLYQILKFIARNHPENKTKDYDFNYLLKSVSEEEKSYSSLVRSTIPSNVLLALSINCVDGCDIDHAFYKYFLLIERYSFLEHLDVNQPLVYNNHTSDPRCFPNVYEGILSTYSSRAFDKNESLVTKTAELSMQLSQGAIDNTPLSWTLRRQKRGGSVIGELVEKHTAAKS